MGDTEILKLMYQEIGELIEAVEGGDFEEAMDEAGDISLYALYFADPERHENVLRKEGIR